MKKSKTVKTTTKTTIELDESEIIDILKEKYGKEYEVDFDISSGGFLRGATLTRSETTET